MSSAHHSEGRGAMRKRLTVLLMAVMMVVMSAAPALAAPPAGSTGACRAYGQQISTYAHQHRMGEIASGYARAGQMSLFIHLDKEVYRSVCGVVL